MAQQFEQPLEGNSLRAQRMTADESRAVIDLWQQERTERTGLTDRPAVPDVAEGLDITVEDVQRLLQDVRARRLEEERALASEQELSVIRLAEEERKLAEVRRQRAELRREQAEADRRQNTVSAKAIPTNRFVPVDLPPRYTKDTDGAGFKLGGLIAGFILIIILYNGLGRHTSSFGLSSRIHVTQASATYDAQGKVDNLDVVCADETKQETSCDDATVASEKAYFQETHGKVIADAKAAALKAAKKNHDQQTHWGDY